jgi:hypothetical protein
MEFIRVYKVLNRDYKAVKFIQGTSIEPETKFLECVCNMTFRRQDLMKKYEGGMQDKIKKEQMCTLG